MVDVSIYVQYDQHVQQAVDETITTRCRLSKSTEDIGSGRPTDFQHDSVVSATIEKIARKGDAVPVGHGPSKLARFDVPASKSLPLTHYQSKLEIISVKQTSKQTKRIG